MICRHYWLLAPLPEGEVYPARCYRCGAQTTFSQVPATTAVGHFSQHDALVGWAIIGALLFGPLAGGVVLLFLR